MKHDKLVWQADFTQGGRPSDADWEFELGGGGWGNQELQEYTDQPGNVWVQDGVLHLCARREEDGRYTSARLTTSGRRSWQYGRIEVEARLPRGNGTWPAIWMMPDSCRHHREWPLCGEIDIMEHVGPDEDTVHYSLHSELYNHIRGTQKTARTHVQGTGATFHTYGIDWDEAGIRFLVDGEEQAAFLKGANGDDTTEEGWPFDQPFFLILNVALGGWGGPVDNSALPCEMQVRAIRVYQAEQS